MIEGEADGEGGEKGEFKAALGEREEVSVAGMKSWNKPQ